MLWKGQTSSSCCSSTCRQIPRLSRACCRLDSGQAYISALDIACLWLSYVVLKFRKCRLAASPRSTVIVQTGFRGSRHCKTATRAPASRICGCVRRAAGPNYRLLTVIHRTAEVSMCKTGCLLRAVCLVPGLAVGRYCCVIAASESAGIVFVSIPCATTTSC